MSTKLKNKKAVLLAEGCKLDKDIKAAQARLKEIKDELNLEKGTYINDAGDILTVSETVNYTDIKPEECYNALKALKLGKRFFEVIKVQLTPLKRLLSDEAISGLRKKSGTTKRYCFK